MWTCLCVGAGGFIGSIFRYLLSGIPVSNNDFPLMTLLINIIGAFAIGFIVGISENVAIKHDNLVLFFKVGICGGFTTFSTYALELSGLFSKGKWGIGLVYGALSVILCLAAVYMGRIISKLIF